MSGKGVNWSENEGFLYRSAAGFEGGGCMSDFRFRESAAIGYPDRADSLLKGGLPDG
jgi:hypothetical protein